MGLGIGAGEIVLILIIALILWGPGKMPEIARTLGKVSRALKKANFDLTSAVTREIEREDEAKNTEGPSTEIKTEKSVPNDGTAGTKNQDNRPRTQEGSHP